MPSSIVVLCEKPSVAKSIATGLQKMTSKPTSRGDGFYTVGDYSITWAYGHLLQNDIQASFGAFHMFPVFPKDWVYTPIQGNTPNAKSSRDQLKKINSLLKTATEVVIATDPGREGELIARLIIEHSPAGKKKVPLKRIWVSESLEDPEVVIDAFKNLKPGADFDSLHMEAVARQHADGDVGINLSRALNAKVNDGERWSIGRVKTPVTCVVAKREDEIKKFVKTPYNLLSATFGVGKDTYIGKYNSPRSKTEDDNDYDDLDPNTKDFQGSKLSEAEKSTLILKLPVNSKAVISSVEKNRKSEYAPLLHTITTLQVAALKELKIPSMKSSKILQDIYDKGFVSYPRTESKYLGTKNAPLIAKILTSIGHANLAAKVDATNKRIFDDSKLTDHHALIPLKSGASLSGDEKAVYDIICKSFLAAFHPPAIRTAFKITTEIAGEKFVTSGQQDESAGWKAVYGYPMRKYSFDLEKGTEVVLHKLTPEAKETQPPPRYTEGTLLTVMENAHRLIPKENDELRKIMQTKENAGLGTGATRARILNELFTQGYLKMVGTTVFPEDKAMKLYDKIHILLKVADPIMTAEWEMRLKQIREKTLTYSQFMSEIEAFVKTEVTSIASLNSSELKQTSNLACPKCGAPNLEKSYAKLDCPNKDFSLWTKIAGKQLTEKQISELLSNKKCFVSGMVSKKSGKAFDAWVKIDDIGSTSFDFQTAAPASVSKTTAPQNSKPKAAKPIFKSTAPAKKKKLSL